MATYTEAAWGSSAGSYPSSVLTKRWTTTNETTVAAKAVTNALSGYVMETQWSGAEERLNSLDSVDGDANRDDAEVLVRARFGTLDETYGVVVRGSGSGGSEECYAFFLNWAGSGTSFTPTLARAIPGAPGTFTNFGTSVAIDLNAGDWFYLRLRANGSSIQAKAWPETLTEPPKWDINTTDSNVTGVGWVGLFGKDANCNSETDWISVGTDGDTAPYQAATSATVRNTLSHAQTLSATANPETRVTLTHAQTLSATANPEARVTLTHAQVLYAEPVPTTSYVETAWGSSAGVFPTSILTKRWHTANETENAAALLTEAEDGYVYASEWSAAARRLSSWDALDGDAERDDIELLARFKFETTSRQDNEFGIILRASGTDTTETGYIFFTDHSTGGSLRWGIGEFSSGTFTSLLSSDFLPLPFNTEKWLWARVRADGTALKAKLWYDGHEEPDWQAEVTDSTHTAAGWNGIYQGVSGRRLQVDYLSAGTDSTTAPLEVDTTQVIRETTAHVHALYQDTATPARITTAHVHALYQDTATPARITTAHVHVLYEISTQDVRATQQVAELAVQQNLANIEARSTQQIVEILVVIKGRITQQVAELAVQQNLANIEARSTQQVVEVLANVVAFGVTQQVAELAVQQNLTNVEVRSTQQVAELLLKADVRYAVTQQVAEVAVQQNLVNIEARSTQQIAEILLGVEGARITQQVSELAVYQNLANIETRSTQQVVEVLLESIPTPLLTQQVAELAVYQNLANVEVRSTQQVVELIIETLNYGRTSQQVAELAVYQDLANVEVRSTQQILEILFFTGLATFRKVTQSLAETAVRQDAEHVEVRSTQQIIEVLVGPITPLVSAYDNYDAQPISIMV